jgi:hypothetical protein
LFRKKEARKDEMEVGRKESLYKCVCVCVCVCVHVYVRM